MPIALLVLVKEENWRIPGNAVKIDPSYDTYQSLTNSENQPAFNHKQLDHKAGFEQAALITGNLLQHKNHEEKKKCF